VKRTDRNGGFDILKYLLAVKEKAARNLTERWAEKKIRSLN